MNLQLFSHFAQSTSCSPSHFLGLPTWYEYLKLSPPPDCTPQFTSLSDVWLIVAAIIEILLRVAALVAIGFIIVGAFQFVTSQGEPDATAKARTTMISALVGLAIAVLAAGIVTYVAGQFK